MRTISIPLALVRGPSIDMVIEILQAIQDSVTEHSDIFEYSVEEALTRIHQDIDDAIIDTAETYPNAINMDYMMVYNGVACDFLPCNEYTDEVVNIMQGILGEP